MTEYIYLGDTRFYDPVREKVVSYRPYFYVICSSRPEGATSTDLMPLVWDGVSYSPKPGLRVYKIYAGHPAEVRSLRERYKECLVSQAGIKFVARYGVDTANRNRLAFALDDKGIAEELREGVRSVPRYAVFDVEVHDGKTLYGWALEDGDVKISEDFDDLLADLDDVDYLVGYNSWNFDRHFLPSPEPIYVDLGSKYVGMLDLYVFAISGFRSSLGVVETSYQLNDILRQVGIPDGFPYQEWLKAKSRRTALAGAELRRYLALDVIATKAIADKWLKVLSAVGRIAGLSLHALNIVAESASPGHINEVLIAKYNEVSGFVLHDRRREVEYGGELKVYAAAEQRLYKNVREFDFHMLYPSTYHELGLDPTTLRECQNGIEAAGKRLCPEPGPLTRYFDNLYTAREVTKKMKKEDPEIGEAVDQAVKILANSLYGVMSKESGYAINEYVSAIIFDFTSKLFQRMISAYDAIYGDTDSVYILADRTEDEVTATAQKIARELAGRFLRFEGQSFRLKLEGIWDGMYIHKAKNYVKWRKAGDGVEVVYKGAIYTRSELMVGWKYGDWEGVIYRLVTCQSSLRRELERLDVADLLIEESEDLSRFFLTKYKSENRYITNLNNPGKVAILVKLALTRGRRRDKVHEFELSAGAGGGIVDVRYLRVGGEKVTRSKYVIEIDGRYYLATVASFDYTARPKPVAKIAVAAQEIDPARVKQLLIDFWVDRLGDRFPKCGGQLLWP